MSRDARSVAQTKARFTGPSAFPAGATAIRGQRFFTNHESRNTAFFSVVRDGRRHRKLPSGPLPPPASRCFPVHYCSPLFSKKYCSAPVPSRRPVTVSLRPFAWHGAAMARHGRRPSPAPATGPVGFSPATRHATWFFPVSPATPGRATPSPANRFFTHHESRITAFTLPYPRFPTISRHFPAFPGPPPGKGSASRSVAAFLRVVARHGAAMARHGRRPSPAPATRPVGFSPAARHATWVFPVPPAAPGRATPSPANGFFTNHESRDTNHGLYAFFPTISRHFPLLFGSPLPLEPVSARRQPRLPSSSGLLPPRRT